MELLLVHSCAGDAAVPFSKFLEPQQTPPYLVSAGIYRGNLAVPLHGGHHRLQSMAMILRSLLSPPRQRIALGVDHQLREEINGDENSTNGIQVTSICIARSCVLPVPPTLTNILPLEPAGELVEDPSCTL